VIRLGFFPRLKLSWPPTARVLQISFGARLTTKVLEIFSPLYVNLCYWAMASITQADYYYLLGNAKAVVDDVSDARYFLEDISLDPAALEKTLDVMNLL
jgi:hypothetical protein